MWSGIISLKYRVLQIRDVYYKPKATTKITIQRVIVNKPTKKVKQIENENQLIQKIEEKER